MESSANRLGPNPKQDLEAAQRSEAAFVAIAEQIVAQEAPPAPTEPSAPIKIDREDLLEYKLLGSRAAYTELQVTMYTRELQRSTADANQVAYEASELLMKLGAKYGVDMRANKITEDGYVVARAPAVQR